MGKQDPDKALGSSTDTSAESAPSLNYAFLVHSQNTLTQNLPPCVDNKMLARQKRRRTTPEDHAILEAEYLKNSKPDKQERAAIVDRVALGEKEVQIWFQNRRQNDRRKSRPLLPHELVPHLHNYRQNHVPDSAAGTYGLDGLLNSDHYVLEPPNSSAASPPKDASPPDQPSVADYTAPIASSSTTGVVSTDVSFDHNQNISQISQSSVASEVPAESSSFSSDSKGDGDAANVSLQGAAVEALLSARKRLFCEIDHSMASQKRPNDVIPPGFPPSQDRPTNIRLSMSLDGKAKVRTKDSETPSPPKIRATPSNAATQAVRTLQRSKSAISPDEVSRTAGGSKPLTSAIGRSRDARTWEFFCDSETRDALSAHAERERRGSAAGAISLIRTNSKKSLLQRSKSIEAFRGPLTPKAGLTNTKKTPVHSMQKPKPKLSRAISSVARMQADYNEIKVQTHRQSKSLKKTGSTLRVESPSGDSDKENWEPGTQTSNIRRRPVTGISRPILSENRDVMSHSFGLDSALTGAAHQARDNRRKTSNVDKENAHPQDEEGNEEVPSFMRGANVPDEEEDLDCIQGLLSLSQGAWR